MGLFKQKPSGRLLRHLPDGLGVYELDVRPLMQGGGWCAVSSKMDGHFEIERSAVDVGWSAAHDEAVDSLGLWAKLAALSNDVKAGHAVQKALETMIAARPGTSCLVGFSDEHDLVIGVLATDEARQMGCTVDLVSMKNGKMLYWEEGRIP